MLSDHIDTIILTLQGVKDAYTAQLALKEKEIQRLNNELRFAMDMLRSYQIAPLDDFSRTAADSRTFPLFNGSSCECKGCAIY